MMPTAQELHVVTGAFGYSGKYIASRLLEKGCRVRTLTNSPDRASSFKREVEICSYNFDNMAAQVDSLCGASVLYNTYWVRFNYKDFAHSTAVENTLKLFSAAKEAGVGRIVHVSITNPSEESALEYFRGKARLERALIESGLSYSILRPAVLFGKEDILINNIAWVLRHMPVFGIFGDGRYRIQPIYVDDLAKLAVEQGEDRENRIINAIGPETFGFRELVKEIGHIIGVRRPIISVPPGVGYLAGCLIGKVMGDVLLTREEIAGLMQNLLCTDDAPAGTTKLTEWAKEHAATLGRRYASELARRRNRQVAYDKL
jgi:uncharacterized protein YbjT (DUF2867 family)